LFHVKHPTADAPALLHTEAYKQMARIRVRVHGSVQGVGFRYFAAQQAQQLGIAGYARNLPDGTVEVEAEGTLSALESFRDALAQGPPSAGVSRLEEVAPAGEPLPSPFIIRR
jgi:acylphosphatase